MNKDHKDYTVVYKPNPTIHLTMTTIDSTGIELTVTI